MSEPVAKERRSVDFDAFERRLRSSDGHGRSSGQKDDPLAELARLVGQHQDPYGDVFGEEAMARRASDYAAYEEAGLLQPPFESESGLSPRLSGDFAAIEAGLRGAVPSHVQPLQQHEHDAYSDHDAQHPDHAYQQDDTYHQDQAYLQDHEAQQWAAEPTQQPAARSRRPIYAVVATIAIGVIGVGAAFAYKGSSSSPSEIKTIAAASGPTKVQPPAEAPSDQAGQDSAILGKGQQTAPTQLVSREEQPVDISQAVQENASRNADAEAGNAPGNAASVPVPPSPSQAREGASEAMSPSDQIGSFGLSGMPAPKKVKVVSVRPDGTILPNDAPPAAALPPSVRAIAAKPNDKPASVAKASTPKAGATPKTTSRVAATPKPAKVASADSATDGDDAAAAPKPIKKVKKAKPQRVASAEPAADDQAPTASVPTAVAPAAKTGGGFAVQLAAPGSEADAKSASSRLAKKYAEALGGRKLGFHKADSNGKSVYRVRVGSLSREEATSLCEKLKADGGSCFVAKN